MHKGIVISTMKLTPSKTTTGLLEHKVRKGDHTVEEYVLTLKFMRTDESLEKGRNVYRNTYRITRKKLIDSMTVESGRSTNWFQNLLNFRRRK